MPEELRWLQYDRLYIVVAEKKTDANSKKYSATTIEHVPCWQLARFHHWQPALFGPQPGFKAGVVFALPHIVFLGRFMNPVDHLRAINRCFVSLYARGGQTCSMYEPHVVKAKLQRAQHKNLKTLIHLQSTLLWNHNTFWNSLQK